MPSCCSGQKHRSHSHLLSLVLYMPFISKILGSSFELHLESNTHSPALLLTTSTTGILTWVSIISWLRLPLCYRPPLSQEAPVILCHSLDKYPSVAPCLTQNEMPNPCSDLQNLSILPPWSLWPSLPAPSFLLLGHSAPAIAATLLLMGQASLLSPHSLFTFHQALSLFWNNLIRQREMLPVWVSRGRMWQVTILSFVLKKCSSYFQWILFVIYFVIQK